MATTRWLIPPGSAFAADAVPARYDRAQQSWVVFVGGNWVAVPPDIDLRGLAANGDVWEVKQTPDGDFDYGSELEQAPTQPAPSSPISGAAGLAGGVGTPPAAPSPPSGPAAAAGSVAGGTGQPAPSSGVIGAAQQVAGAATAHRPGAAPGGAEGPQVGAPPAAFRPGAAPGGAEGPRFATSVTETQNGPMPTGPRMGATGTTQGAPQDTLRPGVAPAAPPMPGPNLGYTNAAKAAGEQRTAQGDAAAANAQPAAAPPVNGPNLAAMGWVWNEQSKRWEPPAEKPPIGADRFSDLGGGNVQGGTQDRIRGYEHGGVHGSAPPMPSGGAGKALMGEGRQKGGPDNNGYQAEIVIHPQAIEQGLVSFVDGPTLTEPQPGTMILPVPKNLQGLAHALPPMPGRPARFKDGGYIIGPRFKSGGIYGPDTGSGGAQQPPDAWSFMGGRPPMPSNGNLLAAYTPSQRGLFNQELAAAGSGLNLDDYQALFKMVGPGVGSQGTWS